MSAAQPNGASMPAQNVSRFGGRYFMVTAARFRNAIPPYAVLCIQTPGHPYRQFTNAASAGRNRIGKVVPNMEARNRPAARNSRAAVHRPQADRRLDRRGWDGSCRSRSVGGYGPPGGTGALSGTSGFGESGW